MASPPAAAAGTGQTKPGGQGVLTAVPIKPPRKVTYTFKATSSSNLSIPYAAAINGTAQAAFSNKPKRVSGQGGKIVVFTEQGSNVSLFLNSDAHPSYRLQPVYEVTVGDKDVEVLVTEKSGKHTDADTPKLQTAKAGSKPSLVDHYTAPLTGDIWMKVSHKYTAADVDALVEAGTRDVVKDAVKSICKGLASAVLTITEPAVGAAANVAAQPARTVKVSFNDSDNPKNNISAYALLTDGLPRVHPAGYAAMFTAALDNGIESLTVSSCWRPMLGSIAHRSGLGLDVSVVGKTVMNRQELRRAFEGKKPSKKGNANDNDNVSDDEVTKFGDYEDTIVQSKKARTERDAAQRALATAKKDKDPAVIAAAKERWDQAVAAQQQATTAQNDALTEWESARDKAEPANARLFRTSLLKCQCVAQLFDPWFMDANARDQTAPEPNMQRGASTGNERLHAHHLHITVYEPKIL